MSALGQLEQMNNSTMGDIPDISVIRADMDFH